MKPGAMRLEYGFNPFAANFRPQTDNERVGNSKPQAPV